MRCKSEPIPTDQPWAMGPWSTQFLLHFALLAEHMSALDLHVLRLICHLLDEQGKEVGLRNSTIMRLMGRGTNMGVTRAFTKFKALGLMDPDGTRHNALYDRFAEPGGIPTLIHGPTTADHQPKKAA